MLLILILILILMASTGAVARPTDPNSPVDWLINPAPYKAQVHVNQDRSEVVLSNGLIKRTLRLKPNAATVAMEDLVSGQSLLRGVKPEALVEIDGQPYEVGGLIGQPNYAFLRPDWRDSLRANPASFRFIGFETAKPTERMGWKRVRHHAPGVKWPPEGVSLRLDFAWPLESLRGELPSDATRKLAWDDRFDQLDPLWRVSKPEGDATSFQQEGKAGAIHARPGTHCFAERKLTEETGLVEVVIHPGTDTDTSWGPGLALVFPDRVVEVNLRPGDRGEHGQFELRDNGNERLKSLAPFTANDRGLDTSHGYRLRVRIEGKTLAWDVADATPKSPIFYPLFEVPLGKSAPIAVRVGKTDRKAGSSDEPRPDSTWTRCRIEEVRVFGPVDSTALEALARSHVKDVRVSVHYELYDGIPCYSKWITVTNKTDAPIHLNRFSSELLATVEQTSEVDELSREGQRPPNIHVETDMAFGGMLAAGANRRSYRWLPDPDYPTQVNYEKKTPCLLEVGPDLGPAQVIPPGETLESFRAWVLPHDTTDRERSGLALRRMYRVIAPWTTENPLMMHLVASNETVVKNAIDQCAEVGFEMLILSFGSGFDMENEQPATLEKARRFSDYARSKGIEIGSYSLLASRSVGGGNDVEMPTGKKPVFGNSPCLQSAWGRHYFERLYQFHRESGFSLLEHDGSYPGDECASENHPGHQGLDDSRWNQWREIADFYKWCRSQGLYLNVPDHYFLAGSSKTGMGYRETNWSLPRAQQVIHTRQNIYDGTWQKQPSMGWMFVPLTQYQGGGAAATIEPLDEHLDHYQRMLESNLALGVQACYRGPRLFDTDRTRDMLKSQVNWYKAHRDILESDLIHGRRADAQNLDWMLHVNPSLKEKGMLVVFNPLEADVSTSLQVNLYYTGLTQKAKVRDRSGVTQELDLNRDYTVEVPVQVQAQGMSWYVIE